MSDHLSEKSARLTQSEIRNMTIECTKQNGINLAQGVCDLPLQDQVKQGAHEAIDRGINSYTRYDGRYELREAICQKAQQYNKIDCDPEKNIVVSAGATGAFFITCLSLLNPGDEMILFEPYYGYHLNTLLTLDLKPRFATLTPPDWQFDIEELEKLCTPKTRAIMINTPANPCGKVFTREELKQLAAFSIKHDLIVYTDEIYEYFLYDGREHISPASLEEIKDRTITISGFSKTYSITGWRIGYCICDEKWTTSIGHINDLIYVCAPAPLQLGVANGLKQLPQSFYQSIREDYQSIRDEFCSILEQNGMIPYIPQGAYYVLTDVSKVPGKSSKEKAMTILNTTGIASVPGNAFYINGDGENLVRFCFAKEKAVLEQAYENLQKLQIH